MSALVAAFRVPGQGACLLVGLGHAGVHWIAATLYLLIPFIARDLGLSYTEAGVIMTVFHVASAASNPPSGVLVDLSGRRVAVQVAALATGALGLAALGRVPSFAAICVAVGVIGAMNMLWHPAAIAELSARFPKRRGYALAIHALGANLGDAVAPLVAGWLLLVLSWPATATVTASVPLAVAAAIALVLGRGERRRASAGVHLGLAEYAHGARRMVADRAVLGLSLAAGVRTMAQGGLMLFLPLYLADVLGLGPLWLGAALMALQIGGIVAAPLAGVASDHFGRRRVAVLGLAAATVVLAALTAVAAPAAFVAGAAVLGVFLYAVRPVIHSWMMDLVPAKLGGSATSLMFGVQSALAAAAPVIGGVVADRIGLGAVFYLLAATMAAATALTAVVPRSTRIAG